MNKKILCLFLLTTGLSYANNYSVVIKQEKNNYIANIKEGSQKTIYGEWTNTGGLYDCTEWTGAPDSLDYGASYDSTRNCSQDQYRDVNVYDVWTNGEDTLNNSFQETKTIDIVDNSTFNKVLFVDTNTLTGKTFSGTYEMLSVTNISTNFTMEAWVKPNKTIKSTSVATNAIGNTEGTSEENYLYFPVHGGTNTARHGAGISIGTNGIKVYAHSASYMPPLFVSYQTISSTSWSHVAVVINNNVPYVYLNGVYIGSGYPAINNEILFSPDAIGSYATNGAFENYGSFYGEVAIARIWNGILTSAQIADNYNKYVKLNKVIGSGTLVNISNQVEP